MDAFIESILHLVRSVPIIPIIIVFSLLKRFVSKKPTTSAKANRPRPTVAPSQPDAGYDTRYPSFDDVGRNPDTFDPSIDPVPADTVFGGEYGKTKFGFDESDWDSEFGKRWDDKRDDTPHIHVG